MIIHIDCDLSSKGDVLAYHEFDTNELQQIIVPQSSTPAVKMNGLQFLAWLNINKQYFSAHGYDVQTKLPGFQTGTTRWNVIVAAASAVAADNAVKLLNLT